MSDSVDFISSVHRIRPIDFERGQRAALICAGSGLMLSLMDACPDLRWCIDVDLLDAAGLARMPAWATCVSNVTDLVVVAGWYCSTNPVPLATAARSLRRGTLACSVQCRGVGGDPFVPLRTSETLEELVEEVNRRLRNQKNGPLPHDVCGSGP
jgi:hypothetical protein